MKPLVRPCLLLLVALLVACGGTSDPALESGASARDKTAAVGVTPQSGIWWNPAESGRGFTMELQGNRLSLAMFMYEASGAAVWYAGILSQQSSGDFSGDVMRFAGGQSLAGSYKAPNAAAVAAKVNLSFDTPQSGSLSFTPTGGTAATIPIQRTAISSGTTLTPGLTIQTGVWWNPAESGRGYFIESQGDKVSIGSYLYDDAGQPVWYTTTASLQIDGRSSGGQLLQFAGGQSLGGTYKAPSLANGNVGWVSLVAHSSTTATLNLPNGKAVPLTRYYFNSNAAPLAGNWQGQEVVTTSTPLASTSTNDLGQVAGSAVLASEADARAYFLGRSVSGTTYSLQSYSGCGACAVGSKVTYTVNVSGSASGLPFASQVATTYTRTN
jgi:hypothetical protein